jgi:hypothetical protein
VDRPSSLAEARRFVQDVHAQGNGRKMPPPPEEPLSGSCCERGCERCVFIVYYLALEQWRRSIVDDNNHKDPERA